MTSAYYFSHDRIAIMAQRLDDCSRTSKKPPNMMMRELRDILWSLPLTELGWPIPIKEGTP